MNVVLVGEGSAATQVFQALLKRKASIVAVLTSPRGQSSTAGGLWKLVEQSGLDPWPAKWVKDPQLAERLRALRPDILFNVYSLYLICGEILSVPALGSYNVHPGPLPKYAGLNSMCWAIYRGETQHGVTVHKMVPEVDAGPIVFQEMFDIEEQDTGRSLATRCIKVGVSLALRLLDAVQSPEGISLTPQDPSQREYFGKGPPQDGLVSWAEPARKVFNFVRACDFAPFRSPWGQPRARRNGQELLITKVSLTGKACSSVPGTVGQVDEAGAEVACRDEWLMVPRLTSGGESRSAAELLKRGDRLQD